VRHGRRLCAVKRILNDGSVAAGFQIDEVRHVASGDMEAECVAFDRGAVEELCVGPDRRHRRELVDRDLSGRGAADHGDERDSRVVAATLVGSRYAAFGNYIEDAVRRSLRAESESAVVRGLSLSQLLWRVRTCGPQRHCRFCDRSACAEYLTFKAGGSASWARQ